MSSCRDCVPRSNIEAVSVNHPEGETRAVGVLHYWNSKAEGYFIALRATELFGIGIHTFAWTPEVEDEKNKEQQRQAPAEGGRSVVTTGIVIGIRYHTARVRPRFPLKGSASEKVHRPAPCLSQSIDAKACAQLQTTYTSHHPAHSLPGNLNVICPGWHNACASWPGAAASTGDAVK